MLFDSSILSAPRQWQHRMAAASVLFHPPVGAVGAAAGNGAECGRAAGNPAGEPSSPLTESLAEGGWSDQFCV